MVNIILMDNGKRLFLIFNISYFLIFLSYKQKIQSEKKVVKVIFCK